MAKDSPAGPAPIVSPAPLVAPASVQPPAPPVPPQAILPPPTAGSPIAMGSQGRGVATAPTAPVVTPIAGLQEPSTKQEQLRTVATGARQIIGSLLQAMEKVNVTLQGAVAVHNHDASAPAEFARELDSGALQNFQTDLAAFLAKYTVQPAPATT